MLYFYHEILLAVQSEPSDTLGDFHCHNNQPMISRDSIYRSLTQLLCCKWKARLMKLSSLFELSLSLIMKTVMHGHGFDTAHSYEMSMAQTHGEMWKPPPHCICTIKNQARSWTYHYQHKSMNFPKKGKFIGWIL